MDPYFTTPDDLDQAVIYAVTSGFHNSTIARDLDELRVLAQEMRKEILLTMKNINRHITDLAEADAKGWRY